MTIYPRRHFEVFRSVLRGIVCCDIRDWIKIKFGRKVWGGSGKVAQNGGGKRKCSLKSDGKAEIVTLGNPPLYMMKKARDSYRKW